MFVTSLAESEFYSKFQLLFFIVKFSNISCDYYYFRGGLVTCGTDGDVRAWVNLMDDDPSASCVSEQATVVITKVFKWFLWIIMAHTYLYSILINISIILLERKNICR